MSYYGAGDYYRAGDYYGAGGIGSFLGGIAKTAVSFVTGGPVAAARSAVQQITAPRNVGGSALLRPPINPPFGGAPGVGIGSLGTPAHMATYRDSRFYTKDGRPRRIRKDGKPWKRPTMDPGNSRAMRRAVRRSERFVGLARAALSNTKWKVASRSSSSRRGKK